MDRLGSTGCSSMRHGTFTSQRTYVKALHSRQRHHKRSVQRLHVSCTAIEPDVDIPSTSGRPPMPSHMNGLPELLQDIVHDMAGSEQQQEVVTPRQQMNRQIKGAETIVNLLTLIEEQGGEFDAVNTAHALHRLAKLWRSYSSIHAHTQEGAYSQLVLPATQLLSRHMEAHMGMFEPWDVAISIWAYGLLGVHDDVVLPLLLQRAAELSPLFKPADCTQVLIGLARLGLREAPLLKELTYVILNQLEDIRAQDLSQVVYSYGKLHYDPGHLLLDSLVDMSTLRFKEFKPLELVNMLYGFALLGYRPSGLVLQIAKHLNTRRRSLLPQDVSIMLWSLAQLKSKYNFVLDQIPAAIIPALRQYKPSELSSVVWAYYCFRHYHKPLFSAIEAAYTGQLAAAFGTQELVTLIRAYATFSNPPSKSAGRRGARAGSSRSLFDHSSEAEEEAAAEDGAATQQRLQTTTPAFQAELAAALQARAPSMDPQAIVLTAKAVTHWGLVHEGLQDALSSAALQAAGEFSLMEAAHMMWAISRWQRDEGPLVAALLRQAHWIMRNKRSGNLRSAKHMLDSIVSSCQRLGFVPWALIDDAESMSIYLRSPTQELLTATWGRESNMGYSMDSEDEEAGVGGAGGGSSSSSAGSSNGAASHGASSNSASSNGASSNGASSNGASSSHAHATVSSNGAAASISSSTGSSSSTSTSSTTRRSHSNGMPRAPAPPTARATSPQQMGEAAAAAVAVAGFSIHGLDAAGASVDIRLQDGISIVESSRSEQVVSSTRPGSM